MRFKKQILIAFCLILNLRILTELPRAISLVGWMQIPEFDINRVLSLVIIVFCIIALVIKRTVEIPSPVRRNIFPLLVMLIFSLAWGIYTFTEIGMPVTGVFVVTLRFAMEIVLLLFIANFVFDRSDVALLYKYFFKVTLGVILLICFLQVVTDSYSSSEASKRMQGPFGSPGTLGSFMHLFIALTLYYYAQQNSSRFWLVLGAEYFILLFTGSVANIIASLLLVVLIAVKQRWYRKRRFYSVFPLASLIVIAGIVLKWDTIAERVSQLGNLETFTLAPGSSIQWRIDAFKAYLSLLGDNALYWIMGMGIGTQRFILHPDYPNSLWRLFDAPGTHNDYLAVLVDFGLIGLTIFMSFLYIVNRTLKRAELLDSQLFYLRFYFYTILLVILSENYIDQLVMFVFIVFLTAIIKVSKLASDKTGIVSSHSN